VSKDLGLDLEDQRIDLEELGNEQKAVGGDHGRPGARVNVIGVNVFGGVRWASRPISRRSSTRPTR
jgi:hypothetical protein